MSTPTARRIIDWFKANARDLPWREPGTTPWAILLSEVMSQQTPVARVEPIWREWMQRWPTPADLAAAPTAEVLRAWSTLGYPRRALRLQECARTIVEVHGGTVPDSVPELLALPGIGDYTARAVACFAFGQNVPVVDINVRRVIARAHDGHYLTPPASKKEITRAQALLPDDEGPVYSAGIMELGALVCTARVAYCERCPIEDNCRWVELGQPSPTEEELARAKGRVQKFAGTDRQVRGKIMALLRESDAPVSEEQIFAVWPDGAQVSRCLHSLLDDGLADHSAAGFSLP